MEKDERRGFHRKDPDNRNKVRGYRRQDERPVERTQDRTPTDRPNKDKAGDDNK